MNTFDTLIDFFFSKPKPKKLVDLNSLQAQHNKADSLGKVTTMSLHKLTPKDQEKMNSIKKQQLMEKNQALYVLNYFVCIKLICNSFHSILWN